MSENLNEDEIITLFQKDFSARTEKENEKLAKILMNLGYFKRFIFDEGERLEFIRGVLEFLKYEFFPKGSAVYHAGDTRVEFGIVLRGGAIVYEAKHHKEVHSEIARDSDKSDTFKHYQQLMSELDFQEQIKEWHATKQRLKLQHKLSTRKTLYHQKFVMDPQVSKGTLESLNLSIASTCDSFTNNTDWGPKGDYTLEEKLLLLQHDENSGHRYFQEGIPTFRKFNEVQEGDTIAEISLVSETSIKNAIIASSDLHLLSIGQDDFFSLFNGQILNLANKKEFFSSVFPDLGPGLIMRLSLLFEEKAFGNLDVIYSEGEEAQAVYVLKSGGVQFITFDDLEQPTSKIPFSAGLVEGQKKTFLSKQKIIIGGIGIGSIFGEEEMINKETRKYFATCNRAPTIVYVLKKQIFTNLIEKYFPRVVEACKMNMKIKAKWREDRLKKNKRGDGSPENRPEKNREKMTIRTTKLLDPIEAQQHNIRLNRPELIFQTNSIKVVNFEARDSRNVKNKVEITTCDPDQKLEFSTFPKTTTSPLQIKFKKFNKTTKQSKSHRGLKPHQQKDDEAIERIKSRLYEKAQGFSLAVQLNNLHSQYRSSNNNSAVNSPGSPKSHLQNGNRSPTATSPTRSNSQSQLFSLLNPHGRPRLHSASYAKVSASNYLSETSPNHNPVFTNDCMTPLNLNKNQSESKTIQPENSEINLSQKSVKVFKSIKSFKPLPKHNKNSKSMVNQISAIKVTSICPSPKAGNLTPKLLNFTSAFSKVDSSDNLSKSKSRKKISLIARNLATATGGDRKTDSIRKPYFFNNNGESNFQNSSPAQTPKGMYVLNRGKEEPKSVFADLNFSSRFSRQNSFIKFN